MPVFALKLEFDDKGSVIAIRKLNDVSMSAERAEKSIKALGGNARHTGNGLAIMGNAAKGATKNFKALASQLLALVGAYKAVSAAVSFLKESKNYNQQWEESTISIGSVIAAVVNLNDAQGKALKGADKYNAAQEIAAKLMQRVQILGLETTATIPEIVSGLQGIIAPAVRAGIALDALPEFAVKATQAMSAMQVPVQQMRTEIEALLSGNINKAQDILATNLGITGEMVRDWKEQGILIEELNKRLEAFQYSGKALANTWGGLTSNLRDAYGYIAGQTGRGMFNSAKQAARELMDVLVSTEGKVGVGEDVENLVDALSRVQNLLGEGILTVTRSFIASLKEINDPNTIAEFESKLHDLWGVADTAFTAIKKVGGYATGIASTAIDGWSNLPEPVREWGFIAAVLGGKKGIVALTALSYLIERIQNSAHGFELMGAGVLNFGDFATMNGEELEEELNVDKLRPKLEARKKELEAAITKQKELIAELESSGPMAATYISMALPNAINGLADLEKDLITVNRNIAAIEPTTKDVGIAWQSLIVITKKAVDSVKEYENITIQAGKAAQAALDPKKFQSVIESLTFQAYTKGLEGLKKFQAEQLKSAGVAQEVIEGVLNGTIEANEQIQQIISKASQAYTIPKTGKGSADSIETAKEKLADLRDEIAQLNGTSLAGANDLAKKLHEIGEQGKKAGESADSIAKLKNAYIEAFNAQRVREFSDALRDVNAEIASLTGDTATERLIENSRRMEAAIEQLYGNLALPSPEATGETGAAQWGTLTKQLVEAGTAIFGLGKGLAESNQTEDLQTTVDLYRELRELNGKYTLGMAEQNRLIELQAELYRRNHIPEQLVKEWELLQKLQSDTTGWGGVRRAARSYYADSMNWGKQFESLTTSVMDNFVDTMTDGLMKGKLSFSDFADSLIRDIMRISLQASTANIVGGLLGTSGGGGGLLGTLGGAIGWAMGKPDLSSGYTWNKLLSVSTGMIGSAHGNVFASGLEPWSNSVVDRPTYFDASHHITGYARGGVFGEAGPEAVMPLTRMSGDKLGVMASYPDTYAELRELLDDSPARHVNAELAETTRQYMEVIRERGQQAAQERAQAAAPRINVIINNKVPGVEMEQEQEQHRNSDGSLDIIATVKRVVAQDAARRGGQMNQVLRKGFGLNPIITRR